MQRERYEMVFMSGFEAKETAAAVIASSEVYTGHTARKFMVFNRQKRRPPGCPSPLSPHRPSKINASEICVCYMYVYAGGTLATASTEPTTPRVSG